MEPLPALLAAILLISSELREKVTDLTAATVSTFLPGVTPVAVNFPFSILQPTTDPLPSTGVKVTIPFSIGVP